GDRADARVSLDEVSPRLVDGSADRRDSAHPGYDDAFRHAAALSRYGAADQSTRRVRVQIFDAVTGTVEPVRQPGCEADAEMLGLGIHHHRINVKLPNLRRHFAHVFDRVAAVECHISAAVGDYDKEWQN